MHFHDLSKQDPQLPYRVFLKYEYILFFCLKKCLTYNFRCLTDAWKRMMNLSN